MKRILLLLLLLITVLGCRNSAPPPTPEEIVTQAATRLSDTAGFHFAIELSGAPAFVDPPDNLLAFRRAEGDFAAPDRAQAVVRVIAPGLVTEVSVISVGDVQWQTNVLTGAWEALPPNFGFNPAVLFDEAVGLPLILQEDVSELTFVDTESLEDGPNGRFYHLTGRVAGERLFTMSSGLIGPATSDLDLWVTPETFELVRVTLTEPDVGEPSVWQVDFSQYDEAAPIEPPLE